VQISWDLSTTCVYKCLRKQWRAFWCGNVSARAELGSAVRRAKSSSAPCISVLLELISSENSQTEYVSCLKLNPIVGGFIGSVGKFTMFYG
jgi:hypothetical protein